MRKLYVILFAIFAFCLSVNAQSDTLQIESLNRLANKEPDGNKAMTLAQKAWDFSVKAKWKKGLADSQRQRGMAYYKKGDIHNGIRFLSDAGKRFQSIGRLDDATQCFLNVGTFYIGIGDYPLSSDYYYRAVKASTETGNKRYQSIAHEGVATVYSRQENYAQTITHAKIALALERERKDAWRIASISHLLGITYHLQDDIKNALVYYHQSLKNYAIAKDSVGMAVNYSHLGLIEKKNDFNKGLDFQMRSNQILQKLAPEHFNYIQNLGNLGRSYFEVYQSDSLQKVSGIDKKVALAKAEALTTKTIALSRQSGDVQNLVENLSNLSEIRSAQKRFDLAVVAMSEYQKLHDSLFSQENKNKIASLETAQAVALKDKEIQVNKLQLDAREKQRWYFIAFIVFLLVIGALLYFQGRNRKRNNLKLKKLNIELQQANAVKTQFFSILNHDLRGPAASVVNYLQLSENAAGISPETLEKFRRQTMDSAENLLETMEDLLLWCKGQMENFRPEPTTVRADDVFEDVKRQFPQISIPEASGISIKTDEDYLKTIMRNLTSNAVKSTFKIAQPKIEWTASETGENSILQLSDNGKGGDNEDFRALFDDTYVSGTKSGLGLHLVRDLAKSIDCRIELDSKIGEGTRFRLVFKSRL